MIAMLGEEYAETIRNQIPARAQINRKALDRLGTAQVLSTKLKQLFGEEITPAMLLLANEEYVKEKQFVKSKNPPSPLSGNDPLSFLIILQESDCIYISQSSSRA